MRTPARASAINAGESALGLTFPGDLRALYLTSDGVFDEPGQWFVIWPLAEVVARNQAAWAGQSPTRRRLLAFGDDGTGAPFCLPAGKGPEVFFWDPVLDEATRLAHDLRHSGKRGPPVRYLHTDVRGTAIVQLRLTLVAAMGTPLDLLRAA